LPPVLDLDAIASRARRPFRRRSGLARRRLQDGDVGVKHRAPAKNQVVSILRVIDSDGQFEEVIVDQVSLTQDRDAWRVADCAGRDTGQGAQSLELSGRIPDVARL